VNQVMNAFVTLTALDEQRLALLDAGDIILQWSLGSSDKDAAVDYLEAANKSISKAIAQVPE